jgi:hypothetical protein
MEDFDAARIPMTDEAVLALLRQHLTGIDSMYFRPAIPGRKEMAARAVHARHLATDEPVLALFDDTVFGSGDEGFVVTSQRLCWKNAKGRPHMIEWQHIDPDRMYADRLRLLFGAGDLEISSDESIILALEEAFHVLAFSARLRPQVARSGVILAGSSADDTGLHTTPQTPPEQSTRPSDRPTLRPSRPPIESTFVSRGAPVPPVAEANKKK